MPAPLPMETRVRIASALVEGNSIRAAGRMVDVNKGTVMALALRLGEGCIRLHNRKVRSLAAHVIQMEASGTEGGTAIHAWRAVLAAQP